MQIIKSKDINTNKWSGGTTKELFIYPENSDYSKREFTYRISTATVDLEESVFTILPDINRYLMVLEGEMYIEHEGQHHLEMKPFDIDIFDGGVQTVSKGKVVDFNLMTTDECDGILRYTDKFTEKEYTTKDNEHMIIYIYKGKVKKHESLSQGDLIILESNEKVIITNEDEESVLIETKVIF